MSKQRVDELAVFGGAPLFERDLHVGRPNIGDRDSLMTRLGEILDRCWLSNDGPVAQEFEARLAEITGVRHCLAVCNGTIGLEIVARAVGLQGEVIVPSFTFVATAHALQWLGISPVFCDVAPDTHNLDPRRVAEMITPRTSGIIGTHVWGVACQVEALQEIAERHRLHLMFDAAHAFGCSYDGRMIGNFGEAEVFSFHATKFVNSFEGGAIATNDDELAQRVRDLRNFGFTGYDEVACLGTNGKMSEVCAAMGLTSLEAMDAIVDVNRENYETYRQSLSGIKGLRLREYARRNRNNYQYVVAEVDEPVAGIDRDTLVEVLHAERILARRYFFPGCHRMEPYRTSSPTAGEQLPHTESLARSVLVLPTGTGLSAYEVREIGSLIRLIVDNAAQVKDRLDSGKVSTARSAAVSRSSL